MTVSSDTKAVDRDLQDRVSRPVTPVRVPA